MAKSLYRDWDGLWTFADNPGGARFFERTLSVCQTLKQQGRSIGQTLHDYLIAHLRLTPAPTIIL